MEGMEVQDAAGSIEQGSCKGNWDATDPACSRRSCMISEQCERITKAGSSKKHSQPEKPAEKAAQPVPVEKSPLECLLGVLESQYDCSVQETDKAKMYQFKKAEQPVIDVFVSKSGKIRLVSKKAVKTLNALESIEQIESVLAELL